MVKKKKEKNIFLSFVLAFLFVAIIGISISGYASKRYQCNDRIDNDNDGKIDYRGYGIYPPDPSCTSLKDNSECETRCYSSADCGAAYWSNPYCYNDDVYKNYIIPNCVYNSTCDSTCEQKIVKELVQDCEIGFVKVHHCVNGVCVEVVNQTIY